MKKAKHADAPRARPGENEFFLEELLAGRHFRKQVYAKQLMTKIVTKNRKASPRLAQLHG